MVLKFFLYSRTSKAQVRGCDKYNKYLNKSIKIYTNWLLFLKNWCFYLYFVRKMIANTKSSIYRFKKKIRHKSESVWTLNEDLKPKEKKKIKKLRRKVQKLAQPKLHDPLRFTAQNQPKWSMRVYRNSVWFTADP